MKNTSSLAALDRADTRTNLDHALLAQLPALAARFRSGEFSAAEYAALYVLHWQVARHGGRCALRRSRLDSKPDGTVWLAELDQLPPAAHTTRLIDLVERYDWREVSRRVNVALLGWLRGEWPLTLCESVPDTRAVLSMQTRGTR
ncbi:MAG TPA: hypothetical protein VES91_04630, partial [Burkholderiaceae bacterium]|nr:hypothetical protein [Burkholderiaceae bacterium]